MLPTPVTFDRQDLLRLCRVNLMICGYGWSRHQTVRDPQPTSFAPESVKVTRPNIARWSCYVRLTE